jgi:hypothetical protein
VTDVGLTAEQLELARLRTRCDELAGQHEQLWRERVAIINGLGLEPVINAGMSFEMAVLDAAGANPDFVAGFVAARGRAADLAVKHPSWTLVDLVVAIRGLRADGT